MHLCHQQTQRLSRLICRRNNLYEEDSFRSLSCRRVRHRTAGIVLGAPSFSRFVREGGDFDLAHSRTEIRNPHPFGSAQGRLCRNNATSVGKPRFCRLSFRENGPAPDGDRRAVLIVVGTFRLAFASRFARLFSRFSSSGFRRLENGCCHLFKVLQRLWSFCVFRFSWKEILLTYQLEWVKPTIAPIQPMTINMIAPNSVRLLIPSTIPKMLSRANPTPMANQPHRRR